MILPIHIVIALASVALATYAFFSPSRGKLHASYALVAATLASGTLLVVLNPSHLGQACTSGLVYVGIVTTALVAAHHRLGARSR